MNDERQEDRGLEHREGPTPAQLDEQARRRWRLARMWVAILIFLDLATLAGSAIVYAKQQDTLDQLDSRSCRNAQIIADGIQQQIDQSKNKALYRQFFPQIPKDQLDQVIAAQNAQNRARIDQLQAGC